MYLILILALLLPVSYAAAQESESGCTAPQLDTNRGCIWPEQLGVAIVMGRPLRGAAILTVMVPDEVGEKYNAEYSYYRVAQTSLILALEGEDLIVRDMFYLPR